MFSLTPYSLPQQLSVIFMAKCVKLGFFVAILYGRDAHYTMLLSLYINHKLAYVYYLKSLNNIVERLGECGIEDIWNSPAQKTRE